MIVKMESNATLKQVEAVENKIRELGLVPEKTVGENRIVIAVVGNTSAISTEVLEVFSGVEDVMRIQRPYKLASLDFKKEKTTVKVGDVVIGGKELVIMAGPCSVESRDQILSCADAVKRVGGKILRGGAYKPRTSPYGFQGLKEEGLKLLAEARERTGLLVVTEVVDTRDVELVSRYADILQIGARNMSNFALLSEVAKCHKPVLLKRGLSASLEQWLCAAEYVLAGNGSSPNVILCHRGITTFEQEPRFTYDVGVIPILRRLTHLPIISDPSHPAGDSRYVASYAKMAVAGGTDGLIIEIHPDPKNAKSDGKQSLMLKDFASLATEIQNLSNHPTISRVE